MFVDAHHFVALRHVAGRCVFGAEPGRGVCHGCNDEPCLHLPRTRDNDIRATMDELNDITAIGIVLNRFGRLLIQAPCSDKQPLNLDVAWGPVATQERQHADRDYKNAVSHIEA